MKIDIIDSLDFLSKHLDRLAEQVVPLWHPLGFVSCVIDESPGEHVTRVHFWPMGERRVKNPDWPIHTHSYNLKSLILSGTVRDLQYRVFPGDQWHLYSVNYYEGGSEIVRTSESVSAAIEVDEQRQAGQRYEVPRGVFHQTQVALNHAAVTVVLLSDYGVEAPKVLGTRQGAKYPYDRTEFDPRVFWDAIGNALHSPLTAHLNGPG